MQILTLKLATIPLAIVIHVLIRYTLSMRSLCKCHRPQQPNSPSRLFSMLNKTDLFLFNILNKHDVERELVAAPPLPQRTVKGAELVVAHSAPHLEDAAARQEKEAVIDQLHGGICQLVGHSGHRR